jgi:hypothetical protein
MADGNFLEVYVNAPIRSANRATQKGYTAKRAPGRGTLRTSTIKRSARATLNPDIECWPDLKLIEESTGKVLKRVIEKIDRYGSVICFKRKNHLQPIPESNVLAAAASKGILPKNFWEPALFQFIISAL